MEVYKAINAVQADLALIGIAKDKKNAQQGYSFRGIDDVYGALAPMLAKHNLCIIPFALSRNVVERVTQKGGVLFYVTIECEFHFVSAVDGSKHIAKTYGEAMDSGDKATNKAMSAAYKYAAFQTFCIPVESSDSDSETHDNIVPKQEDVPNFDPTDYLNRTNDLAEKELAKYISEPQRKRFYAIAKSSGKEDADIKKWLLDMNGSESTSMIEKSKYDYLCTEVAKK